jgi:hypothetical protein
MVTKCPSKYLIETINCPKNWFDLTIKARNMFKDIFVWLKLNSFNTNNNNNLIETKNFNNQKNESPSPPTISPSPLTITNNDSVINQQQRSRTKKRLNKKQYEELVKFYTVVSFYPKSKQLNELGRKLNLSLKFIQNWFANRRRRDNFDRTVSKRKIVNCKLNKEQKVALNALFCKNPYANKEEMRELAELHDLDYGAVSRWLNIKRSTNERLLSSKCNSSDYCKESIDRDKNMEGILSDDENNNNNSVNYNDKESTVNYNVDDDASSILDGSIHDCDNLKTNSV